MWDNMMKEQTNEMRTEETILAIHRIAVGDFSKKAPISERMDMQDAVALGINMLAEEIEALMKKKDDYSGALLNMLEDINQTKEALNLASLQWESTFNAINDSVFIMENDGKILQCNRATLDLLGKPQDEIIGKHCWESIHGTSGPVDVCPMLRMRKSKTRETTEYPLGDRIVSVSVDPIFGEDGALKGAVHLVSDITERKRIEEKLHSTLSDMKRFNRIAAGREIRMIELKREVNDLLRSGGNIEKYAIQKLGVGDRERESKNDRKE
jgi:PAS domain S-box-containing protein